MCLVLTFGALSFSKDANDLALRPIERMIERINEIATDPLQARHFTMESNDTKNKKKKKNKNQFETEIIESAIIKTGSLLALGFGGSFL